MPAKKMAPGLFATFLWLIHSWNLCCGFARSPLKYKQANKTFRVSLLHDDILNL